MSFFLNPAFEFVLYSPPDFFFMITGKYPMVHALKAYKVTRTKQRWVAFQAHYQPAERAFAALKYFKRQKIILFSWQEDSPAKPLFIINKNFVPDYQMPGLQTNCLLRFCLFEYKTVLKF